MQRTICKMDSNDSLKNIASATTEYVVQFENLQERFSQNLAGGFILKGQKKTRTR